MPKHRAPKQSPIERLLTPYRNRHITSPSNDSTTETATSSANFAAEEHATQQPYLNVLRHVLTYLRRNIIHMVMSASLAIWLFSLFANDGLQHMTGGDTARQWAYILLAVFTAISTVLPITGGLLITGLCAVSIAVFWKIGMSPFISYIMTWPIAWSMGLTAKRARQAISVSCVTIVCLSYALPRWHFILIAGFMFPDYDCVVMCLAAYAAGYALRLNERLRQQAQLERETAQLRADSQQLQHMQHDAALQRMIHDAVTSELTYVALITRPSYQLGDEADNLADSGSSADEPPSSPATTPDPRIPIIHEHVVSALTSTRKAIELLSSDQPETQPKISTGTTQVIADADSLSQSSPAKSVVSSSAEPSEPNNAANLPDTFIQYLRQHDHDLHALGFHGETTVAVNGTRSLTDIIEDADIRTLLGELYANIAAHGQSDGGWYAMTLTLADHELRIRCENDIATRLVLDNAALSSGTGLARQRKTIQRRGGSLDTFSDHGVFSVFIELPR